MQSVKFKTDHREKLKYDIDILLIQAFERRKMKTILGDNISGNRGELLIRWTLFNNEQPMEQGDSKKYALSTIQSNNGQWGLTIANVLLHPNQNYELRMTVINGNKLPPELKLIYHQQRLTISAPCRAAFT